jgi:diacylglycerol kinase family enzyme
VLLHNPSSGDEDHDTGHLEERLIAIGHEVTYRSLDEDWSDVLAAADVLVVAGGDGSVRKVLTAIAEKPITVAIHPLGSANNIARTLDLEPGDVADALSTRGLTTARRFDLWSVRSTWGSSCCIEAAGGGLFADVLARAEEIPDDPTGDAKVELGLRLLSDVLARVPTLEWKLEIDGARRNEALLGLEAMNVREIGSNLPLAPEADSGDGLLDLVFVRPEDRGTIEEYLDARLEGASPPSPPLERVRGSHLVLEPPRVSRLHVDDLLPAWDEARTPWVEITRADAFVQIVR